MESELIHAEGQRALIEKLPPALLLMLKSLRETVREIGRNRRSPRLILKRLMVEWLGALQFLVDPKKMPPSTNRLAPKKETDGQLLLTAARILALRPLKIPLVRLVARNFKTLVGFLVSGDDAPDSRRMELLLCSASQMSDHYRGTPAHMRLFKLPLNALHHFRADRPTEAAEAKLVHAIIVVLGEKFGIWIGTDSELSLGGALSWPESKELFDAFCAVCSGHSEEQVRKLIQRSLKPS